MRGYSSVVGAIFDGRVIDREVLVRLIAPGTAFGDTWKICSLCCKMSMMGFRVTINPVVAGPENEYAGVSPQRRPGFDHSHLLIPFLSLLVGGEVVQVRQCSRSNCWLQYNAFFSAWPTRERHFGGTKIIAYQFDGFGNASAKNPPREHVEAFVSAVESSGHRAINIGSYHPPLESARVLREASCFVGIDSGLTQMAYSVGCPVDLVVQNPDTFPRRQWHRDLPREIFDSLPHWCARRVAPHGWAASLEVLGGK